MYGYGLCGRTEDTFMLEGNINRKICFDIVCGIDPGSWISHCLMWQFILGIYSWGMEDLYI